MTKLDEAIELKPCPFCGANEEGFRLGKTGKPLVEELSEGGWRVTCYTCCYSIAQQSSGDRGKFETPEEAIAAWNTRTLIAALEPSEENVERVARILSEAGGAANWDHAMECARAVLKGLGDA